MKGIIQQRAPRAHCYVCGDTEIRGVCHHCKRLMCARHMPLPRGRLLRIAGQVFVKLRFIPHVPDQDDVHCGNCHHGFSVDLLLVLLAVLLGYIALGIFLAVDGDPWALGIIILGVLLVVSLPFISSRRDQAASSHRTDPIYLTPRVDKRGVREIVQGLIQIDEDGEYTLDELSATGLRKVELSFGDADQDHTNSFLKKHKKAIADETTFRAGFAIAKGQVGALPDANAETTSRLMDPLYELTGAVTSVPLFTGELGYAAGAKTDTTTYRAFWELDARNFPIQVFPALRTGTGQQALDLTIQWIERYPCRPQFRAHQIAYLSIHYPVAWGRVIDSSDPLAPPQDPDTRDTWFAPRRWSHVDWLNGKVDPIPLLEHDQVERHHVNWLWLPLTARQRKWHQRTVYVKFERMISQKVGAICGQVRVGFHGTYSGITGMDMFLPAGGRLLLPEPAETALVVDAEYVMRLDSLRHQAIRIIPEDKNSPPIVTIEGVPPTAETVIALTSALSDKNQNFYVRWTVENPPHTGDSADVVNRYWDIGGRFYQGVYPIDFHLVLTGAVTQTPGTTTVTGDTSIALTVQGAYHNEDMYKSIGNTWKRLSELILTTLQRLV